MSGLHGSVKTKELWRALYNTILYSHRDTAAQGYSLWTRGGKTLRITGFDDWFALTDTISGLEYSPPSFHVMELTDMKTLEKTLRDSDESWEMEDLPLIEADRSIHTELFESEALCFPEGYLNPRPVDSVALSPDRLRRLSLLKPAGFPLDCRVYEQVDYEPVIAFRYGPTVRGAMAPVSRETILELYSGEEVWR